MRNLLEKYAALRAPDAGGAGGGGGDPGAGGAGGAGAGGGAGGQADPGAGGSFQLPNGFPDQFRGETLEETLSKLFDGYSETERRAEGLRTKLATMPKVPETPDGYAYEPSEKLKPYFGNLAEDPVFAQARQAFHKHGIPAEAFSGVIEDLYGPLVEQGIIGPPYSPENEVKTFMKSMNLDAQAATSTLANVDAFAKGLAGQLKGVPEDLKNDVQATLLSLTDTAAGNVLLHALSQRMAESGFRISGESSQQGELTMEDLKTLDGDPRIDPKNRNHPDPAQRYDEALRKRYDEAYRRLAPANKASW